MRKRGLSPTHRRLKKAALCFATSLAQAIVVRIIMYAAEHQHWLML